MKIPACTAVLSPTEVERAPLRRVGLGHLLTLVRVLFFFAIVFVAVFATMEAMAMEGQERAWFFQASFLLGFFSFVGELIKILIWVAFYAYVALPLMIAWLALWIASTCLFFAPAAFLIAVVCPLLRIPTGKIGQILGDLYEAIMSFEIPVYVVGKLMDILGFLLPLDTKKNRDKTDGK